MKHLMTQKFVFGLLMAFVLVLGVQSIADALTFGTTRRGDLATVGINTDFTITFSVTLGSNTTPVRNSDGRLISAPATGTGVRIDGSGYPVTDITVGGTNREYRNFSTTGQPAPPAGGTFVIAPFPRLNTGTPNAAGGATDPYHISGSSIVDSTGQAVRVQTGTGDADNPWLYTTASSSLGTPAAQIANADRYRYNDERVSITATGADIIKVGSTSITPVASGTAYVLRETVDGATDARANTDPATRLTSSVTLTLRADAAAVVEIDITDATPEADREGAAAPTQNFTVYVVSPQSTVLATGATAFASGNDGVEFAFDGESRRIDDYFGFTPADNAPVHYSVEGNGRIYVRVDSNRRTTSTNSLFTSSSAPVYFDTNRDTSKVTVWVSGTTPRSAIFIFQGANPGQFTSMEITQGDNQTGATGGRLEDYLEVKVTDGNNSPISGVAVGFTDTPTDSRFIPVSGTRVYVSGTDELVSTLGDPLNAATFTATSSKPDPENAIFVQTDSAGLARVYYQLSATAADYRVTAALTGSPATVQQVFRNTAASGTRNASLEIVSGDGQSASKGAPLTNPLVVIARSTAGHRIAGVMVEFETTAGLLEGTASDGSATSGQEIIVVTGSDGTASVTYNVGQIAGARSVIAEVTDEQDAAIEYDFVIERVEFRINGTGSSANNPTPSTRSGITFSPSSITGAPGDEESFTVTVYDNGNPVANRTVSLSGATFRDRFPITNSNGTASGIVTIPNSDTTITASAAGHTNTARITVQSVAASLIKVSGDSPVQTGEPGTQLSSPFVVRVDDRNNNALRAQTVTFRVTGGGGTVSSTTATTDSSGQASTTLTLGSTAGTNTVTASVSGVSTTVTFTATGRTIITRLELDDGNNQSGEINSALDDPLSVRIVDQDGNGISGELVTFSTIEGNGRFSPTRARTDRDGYASTAFTPRSAGTIEIEASSGDLDPVIFTIITGEPPDAIVYISGNNQSGRPGARLANPFIVEVIDENDDSVAGVTVTFAVTAGGGSVSPTSAITNANGRAQTRLTLGEAFGDNTVTARVAGLSDRVTFRARTGAQVLVRATERPPLYWVDRTNGTLHRLVDEETEALAANLTGAMSIAVDVANNYIYWTAQTGENRGAIRRVGLSGRGAQTLKAVSSIPVGIAVDSSGGTIYWTNARGNILSMPVAGGKVTNIAKNLSNPGPIALSNGVLYWGEETGRVRRMSLTATPKTPVNVATGLGAPLAIAVAKGKVYWVERGSGGSGRLQRANLNGSNIQQLKTFASGVPVGFTIDSSENKIYWTKGAGKIQRANLAGKFVKDIVTGLPNPGSIALGTAVSDDAPVVRQPTNNNQQANNQGTNNQQTNFSQYDINRDGAVNNRDTKAVAAAIGQSGNAIANARTDVDGSGTVDVTDLILVIANLDDDVAAPAIDVDVKALDIDFDRVQEQVEVLLASGDTSIAAQRALLYLQHLLASARPDETVLLANYPNPFNPETWIPYHLAESTEVRVNIYDAQGTLVRALTVGHQSAGYYTSRSRAAYWDGRNALGERVASGIYFYQLETDAISPMRKMVILK